MNLTEMGGGEGEAGQVGQYLGGVYPPANRSVFGLDPGDVSEEHDKV